MQNKNMEDQDIINTVKHLESYLSDKDKSEYLGCSATAAMILIAKACAASNVGTLEVKLSDCSFDGNDDDKSDFLITVKKVKMPL